MNISQNKFRSSILRGLTLLEHIAVIIIIGILATLSVNIYTRSAEKARAAEVYPVFADFRAGFKQARMDGILNATWNPNIGSGSNADWTRIGMNNPNSKPNAYFAYDYWDSGAAAAAAPVSSARNVIIAFRRTARSAYSAAIDNNKWIYMDVDSGETFKSGQYH